VSTRMQIPTTLTRTSFSRRQAGLLLAVTTPEWMVCVSPTTPSLFFRPFAWLDTGNDAGQTVQFTHAQHLQPDSVASPDVRVGIWLHRHPERRRVLQSSVSVKRHLSCIFPAHPRSLASVLIPRPAARRVSASASPPSGLRLSENLFDKPPQRARTRRFSEPSVKAPLGTWERGTSRRFAQECPEGNPGKYKQGETQWHSTKTSRN
jgi:hypothetical protein